MSTSRSKSILDRSNYSVRCISIFELISSYLGDYFYNTLYNKAVIEKNEGRFPSITAAYQHIIHQFLVSIQTPAKKGRLSEYLKFLNDINAYFITWTNYGIISLTECIDHIVEHLIPKSLFDEMKKDEKSKMLHAALMNILKEIVIAVSNEHFQYIIDDHENKENATILKTKIIDILLYERFRIYNKFANKKLGGDADSHLRDIVDKLRKDVQNLAYMNKDLTEKNKKLMLGYNARLDDFNKAKNQFMKLKSMYNGVREEFALFKRKSAAREDELKKAYEQKLNQRQTQDVPFNYGNADPDDDYDMMASMVEYNEGSQPVNQSTHANNVASHSVQPGSVASEAIKSARKRKETKSTTSKTPTKNSSKPKTQPENKANNSARAMSPDPNIMGSAPALGMTMADF